MKPSKIPESRSWLSRRWQHLKSKHGYDLSYFLQKFKESYNEVNAQQEVIINEKEKEENVEEIEADDGEEEEKEVTENDYRTITLTLRKVLKEQIGYDAFKEILNNHQKTSTQITLAM
jgi:hypothetical protein